MRKFIFAAVLAIGVLALVAPQPGFAADDEKPFTIHGEVRGRAEHTANTTDFAEDPPPATATDDSTIFYPYRVRIAAEGHFTKNVHAWIEFQQDGSWGENGDPTFASSTNFNNTTALYQGNITLDQLWSKKFSLRIGRQEIVAGNGLLLGNEEFYSGINHDGAVGTWRLKRVNVTVWFTRPQERTTSFGAGAVTPDQVGFGSGNNRNFWGGYGSWAWSKNQMFEVYGMALQDGGTGGGADQTVNVDTLGVRWARDITASTGPIWNIEGAQQFGENGNVAGNGDFEGRAIEGWFGWNFKMGKNVHRVYGRYEMATGDKTTGSNPTDKLEGFVPMFGDQHNRTGRGDWFHLAGDTSIGGAAPTTGLGLAGTAGGLIATSVGYNGFYNDRHELGAALWKYEMEEDNGAAAGSDLGTALDVWYGFNYSRNVNFLASLSQLSPDDALTGIAPGAADDKVTRLYGQVRMRF